MLDLVARHRLAADPFEIGRELRRVDEEEGPLSFWRSGRCGRRRGFDAHPLAPRPDSSGIWEGFVAGIQPGQAYKYRIESKQQGHVGEKTDPLAFFAEQPPEGSAGLPDSTLADLAAAAGADRDAVASCQEEQTYDAWVAAATEQASKDGVNQTPTYIVDGERVTFTEAEDPVDTLSALIDAAGAS